MSDFLILGNSREIKHIDADEIFYISADGNYCTLFLSNGGEVLVIMQIGKVMDKINGSLPNSCHNFHLVGRSLIINKLYLREVDLTKHELVLVDKRQEGYRKAYAAGFLEGYAKGAKDGQMGKTFVSPEVNSAEIRFQLPKKSLQSFLNNLKSNV